LSWFLDSRLPQAFAINLSIENFIVSGSYCQSDKEGVFKDVVLDEDASYGREPNALLNASVFRSITINLLRLNGFDSPTAALRELANQVKQIFRLLQ
jgi:hypothetical protein